MMLVSPKSIRWVVLGALLLLAPSYPLHAMDEETAKTIADLKAQMQQLMDEVKKLKTQQSAPSATPRLRPPSEEDTKPKTAPPPIPPHPIGYTPFLPTTSQRTPAKPALSAETREQSSMEQVVEGTTEFAPKSEQEGLKNLPMIDVSERGLIFRSQDNEHMIRLGGLLQFDDRQFVNAGTTDMSKFLVRRARPYAAGYFYDDWEYRFAPEFALSSPNAQSYQTTIADAFINYDTIDEIQVQAGKFTVPLGLEMLTPAAFIPFSERSLTSNLIPNRDIGVMIHGSLFSDKLSWAAMVGAGARNDTVQSGLDYGTGPVGYFRLFCQPFRDESEVPEELEGLHFGVGGNVGWQSQDNGVLTSNLFQNYSTDGGNTFLTFPSGLTVQGEVWRISPQLYYRYGPLSLISEFTAEKQGVNTAGIVNTSGGGFSNYQTTAWNIELDWVITGEPTSLGGVVPQHPLDFSTGEIGAWEISFRYDGLAAGANMFRPVNQGGLGISQTTSATGVNGASLALNWYPNRIIRLGVTVEYNAFTGGGAPGTVVENNELGFITRLQLLY
jgi:phosphate-selective porin OprO/OprP